MRAQYGEIALRRPLIDNMARGQLKASVQHTVLGTLWYLLIPVIQIIIYYIFIVVIVQRGSGLEYFVLLTMGIMHYNMLTQTLSSGAHAIHGNATMLLQIKIEPIVFIAASFLKSMRISLVGIPLFFILYFALHPIISPRLFAYPLILALWIWFCWSTTILIATISVFSRDMERLAPFLMQIAMYMSPVIFSVKFFPPSLYGIFLLNPIAAIFALLQWSLSGADFPPLHAVLLLPVTLTLYFLFAHWAYSRGRRSFTKIL